MKADIVYNVDCLDFMKDVPEDYFDLIITDPPYGLDIHSNNTSRSVLAAAKDYGKCEWDAEIPTAKHFMEMVRVSKNQVIFGGNYMTDFLHPSSCWIVWDKDNNDNDFADCELAWTSFKGAIRKFKYRWHGMLQENMRLKERRYHPTQKPVALGRWIIERFGTPEMIVFDPFAGSGSFLLAAKQKGLRFVGCELEPEYCDIINERLKQTQLVEFEEKMLL